MRHLAFIIKKGKPRSIGWRFPSLVLAPSGNKMTLCPFLSREMMSLKVAASADSLETGCALRCLINFPNKTDLNKDSFARKWTSSGHETDTTGGSKLEA